MQKIFEYIGGVPTRILFDNMSSIVAKVFPDKKRKLARFLIPTTGLLVIPLAPRNVGRQYNVKLIEMYIIKRIYTKKILLVTFSLLKHLNDYRKEFCKMLSNYTR